MNKNWESAIPELEAIFRDEIAKGNECGCQLCIYEHGKKVIDIAAGFFDASCQKKVSETDIFPLFSTGKAVLAVLAWKLAEQGFFDFDTPVAAFWKEFDTPEKSGITIEHLLSHRAGLYLLPSGNPDLTDWDGMCAKIAAMPPRNLPGAKCHYHPLTFGWLVGHTLELAAGKPLPELLKTEILQPLGIQNDLFFGISGEISANAVPVDDTNMQKKPAWEAVMMNSPAIRSCCVPSFAGFGNARGLAKFYASVRGGLVSEKMYDFASGKLFRDPANPVNPEEWSKFALGMVLPGPENDPGYFRGHGGAAGAEAFYIPKEDVAFAFVKNRLSPKHPDHPVRDRISDVLELPHRFW